MMVGKYYETDCVKLKYYEVENDKQPLVLIHAQGTDGTSYNNVAAKLAKKFHIYSVDCYGHGGSLHNPEQYNIKDIGNAIADFIKNVIGGKVYISGHSSGGLIAAYIAAYTDLCEKLILEDPPFFACQGERRKSTFNYLDLSAVCHNYNMQKCEQDFVLYYFANQYIWNFFPEKSREKIKSKLTQNAKKYRSKYPDKNLKVIFWPKSALSGFVGMNNYDPLFGEAFYNDSFHSGIPHEELLSKISCPALFMKAKTNISPDGILMAALSGDDLENVMRFADDIKVVYFDCGHGIHSEQPKKFTDCVLSL